MLRAVKSINTGIMINSYDLVFKKYSKCKLIHMQNHSPDFSHGRKRNVFKSLTGAQLETFQWRGGTFVN